ncbi:MAG TPA: ABC transporter permease [Nitrososphaerales archaeon]|nr:ABC transporter permease [Nitrososphaerales archaeon]
MSGQQAPVKPPTRRRSASQWAVAWRRFRRNKAALAGLVIVGFFAFLGVFGSTIAPYPARDPVCFYTGCTSLGPFVNWSHPLGTEPAGYDIYSEILQSAKNDLYVGLGATLISLGIGVSVGALAGYRKGTSAALLLGISQIFFVLPALVIILLFARIFVTLVAVGLGLTLIMLILGLFGWPGIAFVVRGEVIRLRELEFVQAERAIGASNTRILYRHIVPNILSPIIVFATLTIAANILTEVAISFLGFGDPNTATWGLLIQEGFQYPNYWWIAVFPGLAVVFSVLGFNILGDGLSDAFNPRLRE